MAEVSIVDELVRGVIGLVVFVALFIGARARFRTEERGSGPTDIGLD